MSPRLTSSFALFSMAVALAPIAARGQIYTDLGPVKVEYRIDLEGETVPIGTAEVSFEPVETERGPRLRVESTIEYTVMLKSPFDYREEAHLVCDEDGVVTFDTVAEAGGLVRKNTAIRVGEDYHVTTEFDGKTTKKTITAGVRRTNIGLFCGGYLAEPLNEGPMFSDFPLLFPVAADHQPRQRFREGKLKFWLGERATFVYVSALKKLDKSADKLWHARGDYQILVRLQENTNYGLMTYELTAVNGLPPEESELLP